MTRHLLVAAAVIGALIDVSIPAKAQSVSFGAYALPTANCGPSEIASGPDGALWFTERSCNQIGRITTSGAITEYPLPACTNGCNLFAPGGPSPVGIAAGPDGALWFAESGANAIGRITTSGAITIYTLPNPHAPNYFNNIPESITAGADGAMWFSEAGSNNIGRITTSGVISQYNLCTLTSSPLCSVFIWGSQALTLGPDGNVWFAGFNSFGSVAGSISPALQVTEYSLNIPDAVAIAAGPDDELWFLGDGACTRMTGQYFIAKSTTSGTSVSYSDPVCSQGLGITPGPDGALWYSLTSNLIGRVTTSGNITKYPVMATPYGITAGADGNLWFADLSGNRIWQVIINGSGPVPSRVAPLPASEGSPNFLVQWSAPVNFGGVLGWSIYVSDNGGPFSLWLNTTGSVTAAYYPGQLGHKYGFYSIVTSDGIGFPERPKTLADATTLVSLGIPGDVNGDGSINCTDVNFVKASFGKRSGQYGFNAAADLNGDGVVNVLDLAIVTQKLIPGTSCF